MNGGVVLMYVLYPGFVVFHNFFDCCVVDNFISKDIVIVDNYLLYIVSLYI